MNISTLIVNMTMRGQDTAASGMNVHYMWSYRAFEQTENATSAAKSKRSDIFRLLLANLQERDLS